MADGSHEQLRVRIDREARTAEFSGNTFFHKEKIKSLGSSQWLAAQKSWRIRGFSLSVTELQEIFPGVIVEEAEKEASRSALEAFSSVQTENAPQGTAESELLASGLSVAQVHQRVGAVLVEAFPEQLLVYGVIDKVNQHVSGMYIELSDHENSKQKITCHISKERRHVCDALLKAGFQLEPNLQVMFVTRLNYRQSSGSVMLRVENIVAEYTIAKVASLREKTNQRLQKEGLFTKNQQLALPFLPRRLGLITSESGTVIHDFLEGIGTANFGFELLWYPAAMQGESAKREVVKGIEYFSQTQCVDAILVFRGGGSPAELSVFNEYEIARAACLATIPVLSAIGHEEDQSSLQDVSFRSHFGVPKELGSYFARMIIDYRRQFLLFVGAVQERGTVITTRSVDDTKKIAISLRSLSRRCAEDSEDAYEKVVSSLPKLVGSLLTHIESRTITIVSLLDVAQRSFLARRFESTRSIVDVLRRSMSGLFEQRTAQLAGRTQNVVSRCENFYQSGCDRTMNRVDLLARAAKGFLDWTDGRVAGFELFLQGVSPEAQLKRGFVLVRRQKDRSLVTRGKALNIGEKVSLQFADEVRHATMDDTATKEK